MFVVFYPFIIPVKCSNNSTCQKTNLFGLFSFIYKTITFEQGLFCE